MPKPLMKIGRFVQHQLFDSTSDIQLRSVSLSGTGGINFGLFPHSIGRILHGGSPTVPEDRYSLARGTKGESMAKGNHSFTESDIRKRFGAIVGHTVAEVDTAGVLAASKASRNKGRIGAIIEQSVLGYPADSDRRPDIVIDGQPWEVKATGLVEGARGGWRAKEPMSITAVAPEGIVTESFTTSAFWHKAERLLVVYYLYVRPGRGVAVEYAGFEFKGYDLHTWCEVDRYRLEADWTVVREFVRTALEGDVDTEMPNLSTLVNPQLLYLDTSPKWPNRPRFRLKASLVTQMARERLDDGMRMIPDQGGLSSMRALMVHLHGISDTCAGKTLEDLAAQFDLPIKTKSGRENKSLAEQVVVRLFTGHAGKISQVPLFAKAGLVFKTMTLTPTGGRTEDMKLNSSIDFDELCDPSVEFDDSSFAAPFIDSTMVVAVLEERYRDCPLAQCRLMGFKTLWLGTYLDAARALWDGMRDLVFSDGLIDAPILKKDGTPRVTPKTGIPMTAPNWPKSRDGVLFVRGTGTDANDKPVTVNGVNMYRQNVWIKGRELVERLSATQYL